LRLMKNLQKRLAQRSWGVYWSAWSGYTNTWSALCWGRAADFPQRAPNIPARH
jgi:hypothetical protein